MTKVLTQKLGLGMLRQTDRQTDRQSRTVGFFVYLKNKYNLV